MVSAQNRGEFGLFQNQYVSPSVTPNQHEGFSSLGGQADYKFIGRNWDYKSSANGILALDGTKENYFAVPDIFAVYKGFNNNIQVSLGRRREMWSEFDEQWKLGLFQPVARWDYLNPQEQGLTGVFFDYERHPYAVRVFVSGLFIPDQGPNFEIRDGEFASDNRWFSAPQTHALFRERFTKINYQVDRPPVSDIINQASFGAKITYGSRDEGYWVSFAEAIKPLNEFHLAIDPRYSISPTQFSQQGVAIVHPIVVSDQVSSVEAGVTHDRERGWVSVTRDAPKRPDLPARYEQASLYPALFLGVNYAHGAEIFGIRRSEVQVSALYRWDERTTRAGGLAGDTVESSLQRFDFEQVAAVEWNIQPINLRSRSITFKTKYMYSFPEKGGLLSFRTGIGFDRDLRIDLGFDLLGADTDYTTGLMGRYRSNSRMTGGLSYIF